MKKAGFVLKMRQAQVQQSKKEICKMDDLPKTTKSKSCFSENSTVKRPKRSVQKNKVNKEKGLTWDEETQIKRAIDASLRDKCETIDDNSSQYSVCKKDIHVDSSGLRDFACSLSQTKMISPKIQEGVNASMQVKVHAQRKFAQGSNPSSPMHTPVKFGMTGSTHSSPVNKRFPNISSAEKRDYNTPLSISLIGKKRPSTEDFLTFLCLRGTSALPPHLDFSQVVGAPLTPPVIRSYCNGHGKNGQKQTKTKGVAYLQFDNKPGGSKTPPERRKLTESPNSNKLSVSSFRRSENSKLAKATKASINANWKAKAVRNLLNKNVKPQPKPQTTSFQAKHRQNFLDMRPKKNNRPVTRNSIQLMAKAIKAKRFQRIHPKSKASLSRVGAGSKTVSTRSSKVKTVEGGKKSRATVSSPGTLTRSQIVTVTKRPSRKTKEVATAYLELLSRKLRSPDSYCSSDEEMDKYYPKSVGKYARSNLSPVRSPSPVGKKLAAFESFCRSISPKRQIHCKAESVGTAKSLSPVPKPSPSSRSESEFSLWSGCSDKDIANTTSALSIPASPKQTRTKDVAAVKTASVAKSTIMTRRSSVDVRSIEPKTIPKAKTSKPKPRKVQTVDSSSPSANITVIRKNAQAILQKLKTKVGEKLPKMARGRGRKSPPEYRDLCSSPDSRSDSKRSSPERKMSRLSPSRSGSPTRKTNKPNPLAKALKIGKVESVGDDKNCVKNVMAASASAPEKLHNSGFETHVVEPKPVSQILPLKGGVHDVGQFLTANAASALVVQGAGSKFYVIGRKPGGPKLLTRAVVVPGNVLTNASTSVAIQVNFGNDELTGKEFTVNKVDGVSAPIDQPAAVKAATATQVSLPVIQLCSPTTSPAKASADLSPQQAKPSIAGFVLNRTLLKQNLGLKMGKLFAKDVPLSPSSDRGVKSKRKSDAGLSSKKPLVNQSGALGRFPTVPEPASTVDAPVYYPTEEEFADPMVYIEKITPEAHKFGICKIVPPSSFKPECKVTDDMRFIAHNQYIHKMLHRWGPCMEKLACIRRNVENQGGELDMPMIGGIELDLPKLYDTVCQFGGLQAVIEKKRWPKVADIMRIPKAAQDRVSKLEDAYCRYVLPWATLGEEEMKRVRQEVLAERECRKKSAGLETEECISKGRSMCLSHFCRLARNTKSIWFAKNEPSAQEVEREYWDIVTKQENHVCVYAGNIDSSAYGYGFNSQKNGPFGRHPWNLKILTNNQQSILRCMGPIMGITIPTLHVGMLFTTGCWYRDPHSLPWIEYLHSGAKKIWYGIPAEHDQQFKSTLNKIIPDYCSDRPIWLTSDTAMVPPDLLNKEGTSLCRLEQDSGEFVVVFPRSFTSFICCGYSVSESVYFASPDWLTTAQKSFEEIVQSVEPAVFSLEKLLFGIANDPDVTRGTMATILPMLMRIRDKERGLRKQLVEIGVKQIEKIRPDLPCDEESAKLAAIRRIKLAKNKRHEEENKECEECRAICYLSMVESMQDEAVYCLEHGLEHLQKNKKDIRFNKLVIAFEDAEIGGIVAKASKHCQS